MAEYASRGVGNAGLTTGIIGSALGAINSGIFGNGSLGGLFGGAAAPAAAAATVGAAMCSENQPINRYEAQQQARIAELETEVKLRDANTYTDQKLLEVYRYFDGELKDIRDVLCGQAVMNQKTSDSFDLVKSDLVCIKNELYSAISKERDERCCADNKLANYVNATFYPKRVADITTGTDTTSQPLYNPVGCGCCG